MTAHPLEQPVLTRFGLLMLKGEVDHAQAVLRQALAIEPNLPRVHVALARLQWPGPDYRQWLTWLHQALRPALYLEIGVEKGESLALARWPTRVIGVDPMPTGDPLANCTTQAQLYGQRSSDFLGAPPIDCGLQPNGFDLAFIDGDHCFESVLDDLIGLERYAAPGALAVLHDTLPLTAITAAPQRQSGFYTGDGWKLLLCLRALRPDLHVLTLPVAPSGLTLIAGLDPRSTVLLERRADILESYAGLSATRAVEQPDFVLAPLGINDQDSVRHWLQTAGVRLHS